MDVYVRLSYPEGSTIKKFVLFMPLLLMLAFSLLPISYGFVLEHLVNQDFESGNTGWTLGSGVAIGQWGQSIPPGTWSIRFSAGGSTYFEQALIAPTKTGNFTRADFCASGAAGYSFHIFFDSGGEAYAYFDIPISGLWDWCDVTTPRQWWYGNTTSIGHGITLFELSSEYFDDASVIKIRVLRYGSGAITYADDIIVYYYVQYPPVVEPGTPVDYYFRSDTYDTLGISAYGFDDDYTNNHVTLGYSMPRFYSFRVYLSSSAAVSTELTASYYSACFNLTGDEGYENCSVTWACPETSVTLGYQCLKVKLFTSTDYLNWASVADYVSPVLITKKIEASAWCFTMFISMNLTYGTYRFGDTTYRSGVSNIVFSVPLESEIQLWRINVGDYVGFILGAYIDMIGEAFYVIILLGLAGVLYFRYRNFGVIAFFFSIFGGVGGLVWFLVPPWAAAVTSALIIIGTTFIVWRLIR